MGISPLCVLLSSQGMTRPGWQLREREYGYVRWVCHRPHFSPDGISVVTINQRISYDFLAHPRRLEQPRRGSRRPRSWSSSVGTHPCPCASKLSDGRPSTPAPINDRTTLKSLGKRLYNSLGVTTQRLHTSFPPPPRPAKMVNSTVSEASLLYANHQ